MPAIFYRYQREKIAGMARSYRSKRQSANASRAGVYSYPRSRATSS